MHASHQAGGLLGTADSQIFEMYQAPFGFFDVGVFYGRGARLLLPMGWVQASVCGRILSEDLAAAITACQSIRRRGACILSFSQEA